VQHTAFAACDIYPADRAGVAGAPGKRHYIKAVPDHAEAARRQSPVPSRFAEGVQHFEGNARRLGRVRRAPGLCNPLRGKGKVKSKKAKSSKAREEKSKNCKARCDSVNSHGALPPFYSELCVNVTLNWSRAAFPGRIRLENAAKMRKLHVEYNIVVKTRRENAAKVKLCRNSYKPE
jgi:hypothetical protein